MDLIVKHFNELSTTELYEILKTRFEIFVTEQECIYQDLDDKDQDAQHFYRKLGYKDSGGFVVDVPGYEQPMEMIMIKAV